MIKDRELIISKAEFLKKQLNGLSQKKLYFTLDKEEYVIQYAHTYLAEGIAFATKNEKNSVMVLFSNKKEPIVRTKGYAVLVEAFIQKLTSKFMLAAIKKGKVDLNDTSLELFEEETKDLSSDSFVIEDHDIPSFETGGVIIPMPKELPFEVVIIGEADIAFEVPKTLNKKNPHKNFPKKEPKKPLTLHEFVHGLLELRNNYNMLEQLYEDGRYQRRSERILNYLRYLEVKDKKQSL